MTNWKKEIELMHVELGSLQIQIKMREDGTEMLSEKRELIDEQKKQKEKSAASDASSGNEARTSAWLPQTAQFVKPTFPAKIETPPPESG